jgi:hypothetical protein
MGTFPEFGYGEGVREKGTLYQKERKKGKKRKQQMTTKTTTWHDTTQHKECFAVQ